MRTLIIIALLCFCSFINIYSIENEANTSKESSESTNFSTLTINNLPPKSTVMVDDRVEDVEDNLIHLPLGEVQIQIWNKKYQLYTTVMNIRPDHEYSLVYQKEPSYRRRAFYWLLGGAAIVATGIALAKIDKNEYYAEKSESYEEYLRKREQVDFACVSLIAAGALAIIPTIVNWSKYRNQRNLYEMKINSQNKGGE